MRRGVVAAVLLSAAGCQQPTSPMGSGLPAEVGCSSCHGDATSPAPPGGVRGEAAPSELAVGAHRLHLRDNAVRSAVACSDCHVVPATVGATGHVDGPTATVTFSALARGPAEAGLAPAWNREDARCSQVWCHGAALAGGSATAPRWTYVTEPDPGRPGVCGTCHAERPALPHPQLGPCSACHPATVRPDGTIDTAGGHHVNGVKEADPGSAACGACHPVPGASGAHAVHHAASPGQPIAVYGDLRAWADYPADGIEGYVFGCGNCHPLDESRHMDGVLDVELSPSGAPAGSLRARNADAAEYGADGTCSGVYCHSSGQATPAYRPSPAWTAGTSLACDGCHGMPPRYASGPAGSATANTHLVPRTNVYGGTTYLGAYGHFAWHNIQALYTQPSSGQHGVNDANVADGTFGAAPMTCQTCHSETVDPRATGPSGFWWLNTTGNYLADGQNYAGFACASNNCHGGATPNAPAGAGGVLPRRHVNGTRDVSFDPRTATTTYLAPPAAPTYPYWVSVIQFKDANVLPAGATWDPQPTPTVVAAAAGTLSFELSGASYDGPTKTCSAVPCHLKATTVQWGGTGLGSYTTCFGCHSNH